MYRVERQHGRVLVYDVNDRCVFSSPESSYIITREGEGKTPQVAMLKERTDQQVLMMLASSIKLPMDKE